MSFVGDIYIGGNETNINGLLFSKKTSNILFALVPHNLTQYEDITLKTKKYTFTCNPFITLEELSICIFKLSNTDTDTDTDTDNDNYLDLELFTSTPIKEIPIKLKDRIISSNLFPAIPTLKFKTNNNFLKLDENENIQGIRSDKLNIYLYAPFILSLINIMIIKNVMKLKQINFTFDYLQPNQDNTDNNMLLFVNDTSRSYPNGKGKFIFRNGCIINSINDEKIYQTLKSPEELGENCNKLNLNILLYCAISCTLNDYIKMCISRKKNTDDKTYLTKNYKIGGLYTDEIYSSYLMKPKLSEDLELRNFTFTELSEELLYELSTSDFTPNLSLLKKLKSHYKNKRNIIMLPPKFDKKTHSFSLNFVNSINRKSVKNIIEFKKKIKKENTIELYLNGENINTIIKI